MDLTDMPVMVSMVASVFVIKLTCYHRDYRFNLKKFYVYFPVAGSGAKRLILYNVKLFYIFFFGWNEVTVLPIFRIKPRNFRSQMCWAIEQNLLSKQLVENTILSFDVAIVPRFSRN